MYQIWETKEDGDYLVNVDPQSGEAIEAAYYDDVAMEDEPTNHLDDFDVWRLNNEWEIINRKAF